MPKCTKCGGDLYSEQDENNKKSWSCENTNCCYSSVRFASKSN